MTLAQLDVVALRRWVVTARADLATHAASLDRLNVFPVPDGDTGTNLLLTMDQALHTLAAEAPNELAPAAQALAQATLMAARGNSGVILSQLVRGVAQVVSEMDQDRLDGQGLVAVLRRASDLARRGVGDPVEGTMLTVAEAAADGAATAAVTSDGLEQVLDGAVEAARAALLATRDQLEVLRRAGVVDAGGAGYLLVLEALQRVVHGTPGIRVEERPEWLRVSRQSPVCEAPQAHAGHGGDGPAYEVMFLLDETDDERVATMRAALSGLGDSLILGGGPDLWTVHVHVDDVAAALNAGADAGRPHRFAVTRFADQVAGGSTEEAPVARDVCCLVLADGAGFSRLAREAGALVPDDESDGMPSAAEYVAHVERTGARSAVLLAASREAQQTALEVARLLDRGGCRAAVPRCNHPAHVLAALAVIDPDASVEDTMTAIRQAVSDVRTGAIELRGAGEDERAVALLGGHTLAEGPQVVRVAEELVDRMLDDEGELVTLVTGRNVPEQLLEELTAHLERRSPAPEVTAVHGGGRGAVLSVGVE